METHPPAPGSRVVFGWFGARVEFESDTQSLLDFVSRLWGRLPVDRDSRQLLRFAARLCAPGGPVLDAPGKSWLLDRRQPGVHAHNLLLSDLLGRVGGHFALHATAVARDGRALILSAPSAFGKTTLAVHLASRGFGLLADDVTFLDRRSGRVLPFGRRINLRAGTRSTLDASQLEGAWRATHGTHGEEWAVDPETWLGAHPSPCPIGMVVILRPRGDQGGFRRFPFHEIVAAEGSESILRDLRSLDGVVDVQVDGDAPWRARVVAERSGILTRWLHQHGEEIVSVIKFASEPADFDGVPSLQQVGPFQAALELGQEMLNRHEGSLLAQEFQDREPLLVAELAELLGGVRCYALSPGRLDETVDTLARCFGIGVS